MGLCLAATWLALLLCLHVIPFVHTHTRGKDSPALAWIISKYSRLHLEPSFLFFSQWVFYQSESSAGLLSIGTRCRTGCRVSPRHLILGSADHVTPREPLTLLLYIRIAVSRCAWLPQASPSSANCICPSVLHWFWTPTIWVHKCERVCVCACVSQLIYLPMTGQC